MNTVTMSKPPVNGRVREGGFGLLQSLGYPLMANEIISYLEMCRREGLSLQRGMNFASSRHHSVILMSVRPNSPYKDRFEDDGSTVIYEGHDVPRSKEHPNPKSCDQPRVSPSGRLTENGKFEEAALDYKADRRDPERVKVYEKIKQGIWSDNGLFHLMDCWQEDADGRKVFKFKLVAIDAADEQSGSSESVAVRRRVIPTWVKLEVWKRDGGKCALCGASSDLHFDHIIPFSKGGSSDTPDNIQLLCAKHNLAKHDKIQ